jgi:hypothetical protein
VKYVLCLRRICKLGGLDNFFPCQGAPSSVIPHFSNFVLFSPWEGGERINESPAWALRRSGDPHRLSKHRVALGGVVSRRQATCVCKGV